jgi:hypothetical protein
MKKNNITEQSPSKGRTKQTIKSTKLARNLVSKMVQSRSAWTWVIKPAATAC